MQTLNRIFLGLLIIMALAAPALRAAEVETIPGRWSVEKASAWYADKAWPVGCNYLPANAINQLEMWQAATFDPTTIDRELALAEELGFNSLRVYLHDLVWAEDPEALYRRMETFLGIADRRGMTTLFVFFDDCHRHDPIAGEQPPVVKAFHNSGWAQSPGREVIERYHAGESDAAEVARLKGYIQGTLEHFRDDPRIIAWELYNEPGRSAKEKNKSAALLMDAWRWARAIAPSQPLCSTAEGSGTDLFLEIARANSDIISFHNYNDGGIGGQVEFYTATGRPVFCTEYMARPRSTFEHALPILKAHKVAAYNWGFISGKSGTIWPWKSRAGKNVYDLRENPDSILQPGEPLPEPEVWFHDIYRSDGSPFSKDEIELIKALTAAFE